MLKKVTVIRNQSRRLVNWADKHRRLVTFLVLMALVAIFVAVNWRFKGPTYLSDELGYLTKASAVAGFKVDNATSWHGGYSLILAPLFRVFSSTVWIWHAIVIINSLFITGALALLILVLEKTFPRKNNWLIFVSTLATAIYPAWIVMSGYAFTTPCFAFVFTLVVWLMTKIDSRKPITFIWPAILTGYLYWIHPLGLCVAIAAALVLGLDAFRTKKYRGFVLFAAVTATMLLIYQFGLQPWFNAVMTPAGLKPVDNHYAEFSSSFDGLKTLRGTVNVIATLLGQLSYLIIATLGIIYFGVEHIVLNTYKKLKNKTTFSPLDLMLLFLLLSLVGVWLLGGISAGSALATNNRIDTVIYGRYNEMVLLPLLGVSILAVWKRQRLYWLAGFLVLTGIILHAARVTDNGHNNLINVQVFWPMLIVTTVSYIRWMIVGALGVLAVATAKKRYVLLLAIPLALACFYKQWHFHSGQYDAYSAPSGLVNYIHDNYKPGCIGFSPNSEGISEGITRYEYYLFKYNFTRMSEQNWLASGCGVYLTYDYQPFVGNQTVEIAGRDYSPGTDDLYMIVKKSVIPEKSKDSKIHRYGDFFESLGKNGSNDCVISSCFSESARQLSGQTKVGKFDGKYLATTGKAGQLTYGPNVTMFSGSYKLILSGQFHDVSGASVIMTGSVSGKPTTILMRDLPPPDSRGRIILPFDLTARANNVEVSISVEPQTTLSFTRLFVTINTDAAKN